MRIFQIRGVNYLRAGRFEEARKDLAEATQRGYEADRARTATWHWAAIVARRGRPKAAARLSGFARANFKRLEILEGHLEIASYYMLIVAAMDEALAITFEAGV
jgi:hypothetical protein